MKRFLVLVLLMTLATAALAQVSTTNPRIIDSTGTAVASHWQEVDFLSSAVRNVVFLNKSATIALILALRGEDTVASATRYQIQLAAGRTFALGTTQPKVYVKAASGTVAYSVSNGTTASLGSGTDGLVDTLSNRLASPYGIVTDSVGTAQDSWWNTVDLFNTNPKYIEVLNDASVTILAAYSATDTAASRTRYQKRVNASMGFGTFKSARYVYIKSTSGSAAYRVGGY